MSSWNTTWNLILGVTFIAVFVLIFGVMLIIYPIVKKKWLTKSKRKERAVDRYSAIDKVPFCEESTNSEFEDFVSLSRKNSNLEKNTEMDCAIEYRTRGSQLIVVVSQVFPSVLSYCYIDSSEDTQLYFIVYLNGDYTNTPFMPYDLPSLELVVLTILLIDEKKYIIGSLNFSLYELEQHLHPIEKTFSVPFPEERLILPDCLLCLSITSSKSLIKIKIIRLHILDCSFPDDLITGLSLKLALESPDKPEQVFYSSKKKYKSTLMFNETKIFETQDTEKMNLNLKIQLLESSRSNGGEIVAIRGTVEMKSDLVGKTKPNMKWTEALENVDSEVICWYSISYKNSTKLA